MITQRMHFLYSHRTKSADGQYVHIKELTDALRAEGHKLTLCAPEGIETDSAISSKPLDAAAGEQKGFADYLPKFAYELAEIAYSLPAFFRLMKAIRHTEAEKPNIIYERYNLFFFGGLLVRVLTGRPLLLEVNAPLAEERARHGGLHLKALARWCEKTIWRRADAILPVTAVLARHIEATGVDPDKIHVIPNGVSSHFLTTPDRQKIRTQLGLDDKLILGFTGFVREWHGVDLVLDFIAHHKELPLHLLVVGEGPHIPALRAKAHTFGIADKATFTGVVQRAQIPDLVASFDIALQPKVTRYASPLKLMEYMALGRAIIAPAMDNITEVVTDEETALLFDLEAPAGFHNTLERLCTDHELRARLGTAARAKIISEGFYWHKNAQKIHTIARNLLS